MIFFARFFFILIVLALLSACHEKDYNIIDEARNLILKNKVKKTIKKDNTNLEKIKTNRVEKKTKEVIDNNKVNRENKNKKQETSRVLENLKNHSLEKKKNRTFRNT